MNALGRSGSAFAALLLAAACAGDSAQKRDAFAPSDVRGADDSATAGGDAPAPGADAAAPGGGGAAFAEVDRTLEAAFAQGRLSSFALVVRDAADREVYRRSFGGFDLARPIAVASASKLVSALVLFALAERGQLSLDTTTAQTLGWSGAKGAITLRHLLSFTSGLPPEHACLRNPLVTLAACADDLRDSAVAAPPGERFDYGGAHLQVAGRMAEVASGRSWNELFTELLARPLALSSGASYFTAPRQAIGVRNPLVGGGLRATSLDYLELLALAFHGGRYKGIAVGSAGLFEAQAREPFPAVIVGHSPAANAGHPYRYGLGAWLECGTPAQGCARISSPGAFGFTPWLDREAGYYAVIATELDGASGESAGVVKASLDLEAALQPAIRAALGGRR